MEYHVLIVTTSTGRAGADGPATGFDWISLTLPYWRLHQSGIRIGFASPRGGKPPGDAATARAPITNTGSPQAAPAPTGDERAGSVNMFLGDGQAVDALSHSIAIDKVDPLQWDALLIADGMGGLWDLADSDALGKLVAALWNRGAVISAIGAGAAGLAPATRDGGQALVSGLRMTCLTDDAAMSLGVKPPILPQSFFAAKGADLQIAEPEDACPVVEDGRLITAQDARGAAELALQLLDALEVNGPAASAARRPRSTDPNVSVEGNDDGLPETAVPPEIPL